MTLPLAGIRVLDLATVIAGPGAARYLADYGADVLKIERPGTGDATRQMGLPDPADGTSLYWKLVSRGKRCATVDLKTADGRDTILRLVEDAHVVVENFRPGTLERLGLGPEVLLARNSRLVVLRVTGFGQDGPYAGRAGFATIAEAMSGFAAINGDADGGPVLPPIALTDEVTALDRRLRHHGGAVVGGGPGGGREPPGVALPVHGAAARRLRHHRLPATPPGLGDPLLRAAGHLALR